MVHRLLRKCGFLEITFGPTKCGKVCNVIAPNVTLAKLMTESFAFGNLLHLTLLAFPHLSEHQMSFLFCRYVNFPRLMVRKQLGACWVKNLVLLTPMYAGFVGITSAFKSFWWCNRINYMSCFWQTLCILRTVLVPAPENCVPKGGISPLYVLFIMEFVLQPF